MFAERTTAAITQLSIGSIYSVDRPISNPTAHGEITVRSAYHLQWQVISSVEGECSRASQNWALWR